MNRSILAILTRGRGGMSPKIPCLSTLDYAVTLATGDSRLDESIRCYMTMRH